MSETNSLNNKNMEKVFNFQVDDIKRFITYDMKVFRKMKKSFKYVSDKLIELGHFKNIESLDEIDLSDASWEEGKSYDWYTLTYKNVTLLIRKYGGHFTIFHRTLEDHELSSGRIYTSESFGAFTFYVDHSKAPDDDHDMVLENSLEIFTESLKQVFELLIDNSPQCFWNPRSFERPDYCEAEVIYYSETIISFDKLIYACEEMSHIHHKLFSENDVLEKLKEGDIKEGDAFYSYGNGDMIVEEVVTEFPKQYSEPYYHGVGLRLKNKDGKEEFLDVYRITRWSLDQLFPELKEKK